MRVEINGIVGLCSQCGGDEFVEPPGPRLSALSPLACVRCGKTTTYGDLLCQIGHEAVNQSRHVLRLVDAHRAAASSRRRKDQTE